MYFNEFIKRVLHNKTAIVGFVVISFIVLIGVFGPLIITHDPLYMDFSAVGQTPSDAHVLGTDDLGRDIFSRIVMGTRTSLVVGVLVVILGCIIGVTLGAISGYYGGAVDMIIMKIVEILMAFPALLLALLFVTIMGAGLTSCILGIGLAAVPRFARIVRGSVLSIKEKEHVEAARAIGQKNLLILVKHVLPNCLGPIIVQATLTLGNSIITVASLGFLGLGAEPGYPEWGAMLSDARNYLRTLPHIAIYPGIAIATTVFGFNLLGDGLRDILDVRQD